jgi:biopolymer transport protein ExbD
MALNKGFLRPTINASTSVVLLGVALGTVASFLLYYFFYYFRETLRILTGYFTHTLLVELTPQENFYYNLFYGSIAAVLGFYVFAYFVLSNPVERENARRRIRQRQILNDLSFVGWTFLNGFGRFTSLLGIWFLTLPLQFDINFLAEFSLLLILIPVVLFLNAWTLIVKYFGGKAYRWFLYTTVYLSVLSFGYANINLIDYQRINQEMKEYGGEWAHGITVPQSESHEVLRTRSWSAINIYLNSDSSQSSNLVLHYDFVRKKIDLNEVQDYVAQKRVFLDSLDRDHLEAVLRIDKQVPLSLVYQLKQALRKAGVNKISYSTGAKHGRYPVYHPSYRNLGISQKRPPYYPALDAFLDSAERLDPAKYRIRLVESDMYRVLAMKKTNRVVLTVDAAQAYLNGTPLPPDSLFAVLYGLTKRYTPNFVVIYVPDETISYGRYIAYLDLAYRVTDRLRSEATYSRYGHSIDCWQRPKDCAAIEEQYPRNVLEWTQEERRLIKLLDYKPDTD